MFSSQVDEIEQNMLESVYAFVELDEEAISYWSKEMKKKGQTPLVLNFLKEYDSVDYMVENYARYRAHSDKPQTFFYMDSSKFNTGYRFLK